MDGGNDGSGNRLTIDSIGTFDLLKIISSHPQAAAGSGYGGYGRRNRWEYLGLVNEPCFEKAHGTRSEPVRAVARHARRQLPAGSVCQRTEVSRGKIGARGKTVPIGSYYG